MLFADTNENWATEHSTCVLEGWNLVHESKGSGTAFTCPCTPNITQDFLHLSTLKSCKLYFGHWGAKESFENNGRKPLSKAGNTCRKVLPNFQKTLPALPVIKLKFLKEFIQFPRNTQSIIPPRSAALWSYSNTWGSRSYSSSLLNPSGSSWLPCVGELLFLCCPA